MAADAKSFGISIGVSCLQRLPGKFYCIGTISSQQACLVPAPYCIATEGMKIDSPQVDALIGFICFLFFCFMRLRRLMRHFYMPRQ